MAGFLYVGAGIGMIFIALMRKIKKYEAKELKLTKSELPYTIAMIVLDIAAPICLLFGLNSTTAANASLLNNFEIVATAIIALMVFKEKISTRLWNNCTRKISSKDPLQIVLLKGIFSGIGSLIIGLFIGERIEALWSIVAVLCVGFVAYGLSIYFYVYAQRLLGAARTSAYYAVAPFIAAILSLIIFREIPDVTYFVALVLMIVGAWLSSQDKPLIRKVKNE